jgi:hypothetical protein
MEATMKVRQVLGGVALAASFAMIGEDAYAFDFNGAWATNAGDCAKIFQKDKDGALSIAEGSDMYGSGFIVRNNAIVGNNATCKIVSQKVAGPITHMIAQCAAENVALSTFQFSYRVNDDNNIVRIYPGVEELNVNYSRCKF